MQGMKFRTSNGDSIMMGQGRSIVVDSGTNFLHLPKRDYWAFFKILSDKYDFICYEYTYT